MKQQTYCVFCGSKPGLQPSYAQQATRLGSLLVEHGHNLVFGGGNTGLMKAVADGYKQFNHQSKGKIIGITIDHFVESDLYLDTDEVIVADSLQDRKKSMFDLADVFVVLPGGIGTLDEALDVWAYCDINKSKKNLVIVNHHHFYSPLLRMIERMKKHQFLTENTPEPRIIATVDDLFL